MRCLAAIVAAVVAAGHVTSTMHGLPADSSDDAHYAVWDALLGGGDKQSFFRQEYGRRMFKYTLHDEEMSLLAKYEPWIDVLRGSDMGLDTFWEELGGTEQSAKPGGKRQSANKGAMAGVEIKDNTSSKVPPSTLNKTWAEARGSFFRNGWSMVAKREFLKGTTPSALQDAIKNVTLASSSTLHA